MRKKEIFFAIDDKEFDTAAECARYELETFPEFANKLNEVMSKVYPQAQLHWFTDCFPCCSHEVSQAGFEQEHWQYWVNHMRQPHISDDENSNTVYEVVLKAAPNKKSLYEALYKDRGVSLGDFMKQIKESPIIYQSSHYYDINHVSEKLAAVGVEFEVSRKAKESSARMKM